MLYLIGGASRAGKSLLARRLLIEHGVPGLPLDAIMVAASRHSGFQVGYDDPLPQRAAALWPFTADAIFTTALQMPNYAFEGDCLLPQHVAAFRRVYPQVPVRAVFLGYAQTNLDQKLRDIRQHLSTNDWTSGLDDAALTRHILRQMEFSQVLQAQCARWGLSYVEMAGEHTAAMDLASAHLMQGPAEGRAQAGV